MTKFNSIFAAAAVIGATLAAPATAAVTYSFGPGLATPAAGYVIVNAFDNANGLTGTNFRILTPPANSDGAPPANSIPSGTSYLSVLTNGSATYNFAAPVSAFQFDWGSIDGFNTLTVRGSAGTTTIVGSNVTNQADGNQIAAGSNGRFTVTGNAGELFNSVTFASSSNSFEVDNLAVRSAVPEPATWAMMIAGFGMVGGTMRRRATKLAFA